MTSFYAVSIALALLAIAVVLLLGWAMCRPRSNHDKFLDMNEDVQNALRHIWADRA